MRLAEAVGAWPSGVAVGKVRDSWDGEVVSAQ